MIAQTVSPIQNALSLLTETSTRSQKTPVKRDGDSEKLSFANSRPFAEGSGIESLRETLQRFFDQIFRDNTQRDRAVDRVIADLQEARKPIAQTAETEFSFSLRMTNLKVDYSETAESASFQFSQTVLEVRLESSSESTVLPSLYDLTGEKISMQEEDLQKGLKRGYYSRRHVIKEALSLGVASVIDSKKEAMDEARKVMEELKNFTAAIKDYRTSGNIDPLKFFFEQQA